MKYKYKDIESDSFCAFMIKVNKLTDDEKYNAFKEIFKLTEQDIKLMIKNYQSGEESLKSLARKYKINNLKYVRWIFEYKHIHIKTQVERMNDLNTKIIPKIMEEKYGVKNAFQLPEIVNVIQFKRSQHKDEIYEKVKATNMKKYGCENVFQNEEIKENIKKTNLEKYGCEFANQSTEVQLKARQTRIAHGIEIDKEQYGDAFKQYDSNVVLLSRKVWRRFKDYIDYNHIYKKNKGYSIDHILSVFDGFLLNLNIYILCHPCNLRVITLSENVSKSTRSDIDLKDLLKNIKKFNRIHSEHPFIKLFNENVTKEELLLRSYKNGKNYANKKNNK